MPDHRKINIDDYNYALPEHRIAKYPLSNRNKSKLLVFSDHAIKDDMFENLISHINSNSLMIFNNTRVIQARILFHKNTGAKIEIFCLEPLQPSDHSLNFQQNKKCSWKCLIGNLKKWKSEYLNKTFLYNNKEYLLTAKKVRGHNNVIEFNWNNKNLTFSEILGIAGQTPIPPYLNRSPEPSDKDRYQTVYSKYEGSVAAPTAGLHFTRKIFNDLKHKKILHEEITLHVGAGTFVPVRSDIIGDHIMHTEHILVSNKTIENILINPDRIIAVGTTSLRTLESLYWMGVKIANNPLINRKDLHTNQWEPYVSKNNIKTKESLDALLTYMNKNKITTIKNSTQIIIVPGYDFKIVNGLITNNHQPKSTLLLLIAAFIGESWEKVYDHSLKNDYRFLSYGDCSLLYR